MNTEISIFQKTKVQTIILIGSIQQKCNFMIFSLVANFAQQSILNINKVVCPFFSNQAIVAALEHKKL